MLSKKEIIICAAIKIVSTNKIYYGHRHNNCFDAAHGELSWTLNRQEIMKIENIQGFVTSYGRFVDREEGMLIAVLNNQIISNKTVGELYSEDIY